MSNFLAESRLIDTYPKYFLEFKSYKRYIELNPYRVKYSYAK